MNATEKRAIRKAIARLKGQEGVSPEVLAALTGPCKLYLDTWVIGPLELLAKDDRSIYELRLAGDL